MLDVISDCQVFFPLRWSSRGTHNLQESREETVHKKRNTITFRERDKESPTKGKYAQAHTSAWVSSAWKRDKVEECRSCSFISRRSFARLLWEQTSKNHLSGMLNKICLVINLFHFSGSLGARSRAKRAFNGNLSAFPIHLHPARHDAPRFKENLSRKDIKLSFLTRMKLADNLQKHKEGGSGRKRNKKRASKIPLKAAFELLASSFAVEEEDFCFQIKIYGNEHII